MVIKCRAMFGIGVTSPSGAYTALKRKVGVDVVSASTIDWPTKVDVVIVSGLHVLTRFVKKIKHTQVLVISDMPSMLRCIEPIVPLDFNNKLSYLFNFVEPNFNLVTKAVRTKTTIVCEYTNVDQLGYVINNLKASDGTINAFISLLSNIPFDGRDKIYKALSTFFNAKHAKIETVLSVIEKETKDPTLDSERNRFTALFREKGEAYYEAFNCGLPSSKASEKFGVDEYALAFFKKKNNAQAAPKHRLDGLARGHA